MPSPVLFYGWPAVLVAGPLIGFVLGPRLGQALSRRLVLITITAAILVVAMAWARLSFPGVLADHLVLAAVYVWMWLCLGMVPSRVVRAVIFGLPTLFALWVLTRGSAFVFFLVIALADLTALPERAISLECSSSTRVVRMRRYGWVPHSGYEWSIYSRPWGVPLEFRRETRRFDDGEYVTSDLFSARVVGGGDCTTILAYDGHDAWSVR